MTPTMFTTRPEPSADVYNQDSYFLFKNGISPEFLSHLQNALDTFQAEQQNVLEEWEIKNKKQQFLFELPNDDTFLPELFATVGLITGRQADQLTLTERHLNIYSLKVNPNPPPHKDRLASEITMVVPINANPDSRLILYPDHERMINPFVTAAFWRTSLDETDLPQNKLKDVEPVVVDVRPGDAVLFPGSSIYHDRINGAGTSILTLKFNTLHLDPLGEDPKTVSQRDQTLSLLEQLSDEALLECLITVAPQLYRISRHYTRHHWQEVVQAYVWGEKEFTLTELDFNILTKLNGPQLISELLTELQIPLTDLPECITRIRRMAQLGGIDIIAQ